MSQPVNPAKRLRAFVTTSPGLESALLRELEGLGHRELSKGRAGVSLSTDRAGLERLTVSTRLGHRVLWQLAEVDARDGDTLYRETLAAVRWVGFLPMSAGNEKTLAVAATCRDTPAFRDARYAGLRVKDAICDAVREATGRRPDISPEDPDVLVRVSIVRGRGVLSLDAAGKTSLHARGYRTDAGEAPLRETLAAALPELAGWDGKAPIVDPMCGSGTILIEAALRMAHILPGHLGRLRPPWGFTRWPGHVPSRLSAWLEGQRRSSPEVAGPVLAGGDIDEAALATARVNADRAGVARLLRLAGGDARDPEHLAALTSSSAGPGLVLTNPPWGGRLMDGAAARGLMAELGASWRRVFSGWRAAVLVPDEAAAAALELKKPRLVPLESGALRVLLAVGEL